MSSPDGKRYEWLLKKLPCRATDVPLNRRCFRELELAGYAEYVNDLWQITNAGKVRLKMGDKVAQVAKKKYGEDEA